jgi:thioredoxin-like negative regulator of GroEL
MLLPRLERAAMNQADNGRSTVSRYGIWASTVNSCLNIAQQQIADGQPEEAVKLIKKVMRSMSAFEEIQALFDPWLNGEGK